MTLAALAQQAVRNPLGIAVINNGVRIDYATLARRVAGATVALAAQGLGQGASVAIQCADANLHFLLLLACEAIGAVSVSFESGELKSATPLPLLSDVDLVATEHPDRVSGARRVLPITKPFISAILTSVAPMMAAPESSADPMRIQRTSGTTGAYKRVLLRRGVREARIASWTRIDEIARGHRVLIALRFTFANAYWQSAMALRAGATIVFENRITLAEALTLHRIDRVALMPIQLRDLLDRLPPHFVRPPALAITTIGGRVAPVLRQRALDTMAVGLREVYSGNEVGNIAVIEGNGVVGALCPGVRVEIVDYHEAALADGSPGRIRVRTDTMVDGFIGDPATTARMFRDGWFYPGDTGIRHGPGRLEMLGREDELLNIGGHKVPPEDLEEKIRGLARIDDVGVCMVPDANGIGETWIAAAYDASDDRDLAARLAPALRDYPYGRVRVIKLAAIPRTDTGKIKRVELRNAVMAAAKAAK